MQTNTVNTGISQLEKLKSLQKSANAQTKKSNMSSFADIVGVYLGTEPKEHYPKLLDESGNKIKDENGSDKRSEKQDGWTYTFAEFGTCKKVQIVLKDKYDIKIMTAYTLSGLGYDIKSANMIFIQDETSIKNY